MVIYQKSPQSSYQVKPLTPSGNEPVSDQSILWTDASLTFPSGLGQFSMACHALAYKVSWSNAVAKKDLSHLHPTTSNILQTKFWLGMAFSSTQRTVHQSLFFAVQSGRAGKVFLTCSDYSHVPRWWKARGAGKVQIALGSTTRYLASLSHWQSQTWSSQHEPLSAHSAWGIQYKTVRNKNLTANPVLDYWTVLCKDSWTLKTLADMLCSKLQPMGLEGHDLVKVMNYCTFNIILKRQWPGLIEILGAIPLYGSCGLHLYL